MGQAIGAASFIAVGQQTVFGTVQTTLVTMAHIRTGSVLTFPQSKRPRQTTSSIMPKASQTYDAFKRANFDVQLELVPHDTAFLPLLLAAWGRRLKTGAGPPFIHTYTLWNAPVDGGTDGTPTGTFYNHSLTVREILGDGVNTLSPRVVQDICVDKFTLTMEQDAQVKMQFSGTGQKHAASSAPSFVDVSGAPFFATEANATGNSGVYVGTANPPTTALLAKRVIYTMNNNMRYIPFLGATAGADLKTPTRAAYPDAQFQIEMDYEDTSGTDAVQLMTDFIAGTQQNVRIEYYRDANNSIELIASGATKPCVIDDPRPVYNGEGVVGFNFNLLVYPELIGDPTATNDNLKLVQTTAA